MKFSLRTALAAITLLGIGLGMYVEHDWLGIVLLLPTVAMFAAGVYLWRAGKKTAWVCSLTAYLILWGGTEIYGLTRFDQELQRRLISDGRENAGPYRRLSFDPRHPRRYPMEPPPWLYLSAAHSPCPLVLYVDYGMMVGPAYGYGGRSYFLWCGGWHWITGTPYWIS